MQLQELLGHWEEDLHSLHQAVVPWPCWCCARCCAPGNAAAAHEVMARSQAIVCQDDAGSLL